MNTTQSIEDLIQLICELKSQLDLAEDTQLVQGKIEQSVEKIRSGMHPMQRVHLARNPLRPNIEMIQKQLFCDFIEIHGDRQFADDAAIYGGVGTFLGRSWMLIGHHKGVDLQDRIHKNFGMPRPEGYRKALRLAKLAEKFGIPILFVIDTPGAHSDLESEQRGQGMAIAKNIYELSGIRVPTIAVITGEGSSGGALAIGVADRVLMLENSVYSVISPESCASILFRSADKKEIAAEQLHLDAQFLLEHKVIHEVIQEPFGCAHLDPVETIKRLEQAIYRHFEELKGVHLDQLMEQRYTFFRQMGEVSECSN